MLLGDYMMVEMKDIRNTVRVKSKIRENNESMVAIKLFNCESDIDLIEKFRVYY